MRRKIEAKLKPTARDTQGNITPKNKSEFKTDLDDAEKLIDQFTSKVKRYGSEDFVKSYMGDTRAFGAMVREAERSLASYDIKRIEVAPEARRQMFADLQASAAAIRLEFPAIIKIEEVVGASLEEVGVNGLMTKWEERVKEETTKQVQQQRAGRDLEQARAVFGNTRRTVSEDYPNPAANESLWRINEYINKMEQLSRKAEIPQTEMLSIAEAGKQLDYSAMGKLAGPALQEKVSTMLHALGQMKAAQEQASKVGPVDQNLVNQIKSVNDLEAAWKRADAAKKGALGTTQEKTPQEKKPDSFGSLFMQSFGGLISRFDAGGFARGTDTIPAMLSAGEFVMNAKSSKQFYGQLVAMNAGVQPSFRNQGGNVTNVGDITVNVKGGNSGTATGREIANALRRELRRGTSALV